MAEIKSLGTRGLTGLLGDVRKNNNFVVHITDVTVDGNDIDLVIQKAFLPQVSLQVLELRRGNDAKKLAGVATWQGGQITILDTLSRKELDVLLEWFYQTYDPSTGAIGVAERVGGIAGYKKSGYIVEYASDGRFQRRWNVQGMWISTPNFGDLDAADGSLKQMQFTIEIDPGDIRPIYYDGTDKNWSDN